MAALFWRLVFLAELVSALALTAVVAATSRLSWPILALAALGILLLWPWILVGISFMFARVIQIPRRMASRSSGIDVLRAWLTESLAFQRAVLSMCIEPWRRWRFSAAPDSRGPVLLIHGIACNRGVWRALAQKLLDHGFGPVRAVNLEPLFADIDLQATRALVELRQLRRDCGGARVTIVAHSMGGLVARAALRLAGPDDIAQIVTLGSPHHGSALSVALPNPPYRQMRIGSPWLKALNRTQEGRFLVPITTIYSVNDNLVVPASNATLAGATSIELRGVGHLGLLSARQSIDRALEALIATAEQGAPCHA